jgi:hypothetical protein
MSDNLPALPGPQTAEIIRFPLTKAIQNHGYLNGWGQTEKLEELRRIDRRITVTISALQRRQRAANRAAQMELTRITPAAANTFRSN